MIIKKNHCVIEYIMKKVCQYIHVSISGEKTVIPSLCVIQCNDSNSSSHSFCNRAKSEYMYDFDGSVIGSTNDSSSARTSLVDIHNACKLFIGCRSYTKSDD